MAVLLNAQGLSKSYAAKPLFAEVALAIDDGARVGLIGPNGSGKSTLLKILAGREDPDTGSLTLRKGLRVGYVAQLDVFDAGATPLSAVVAGMSESWGNAGAVQPHEPHDAHEQHEREVRASVVLSKAGFTRFDQSVDELSGGWRKRLAIARQIAREPDLLLLDEPTNHLDVEGIEWLEDTLDAAAYGAVVVTHDRYFLEEATTRVVELSGAYPQGTFDVDGPYSVFLERRAEFLASQAKQEQALAGKVRQDIEWLKRGAKARRTKAKGRIQESADRAAELAELRQRNTPNRAAGIDFAATGRATRNLLVAKGIAKSLGDRKLFDRLDLTLSPGTRVGLLGPNGSGKTTLIRVLTGELAPDAGTIKRAENLRVATFTQRRAELDRRKELRAALCPLGDTVEYRGRSMHVVTWAQRFLFRREQMNVPVGDLSGGEQARILIADLMRQPADLLVLDEPTNDLDIASLEVLEDALSDFPGAVLLVTHDRFMLDRLSTLVIGLDGAGGAKQFATYTQWAAAQEAAAREASKPATPAASPATAASSDTPAKPKRLTYNEQRELAGIEQAIQTAEAEVATLESKLNDPALLADHAKMHAHYAKLGEAQTRVTTLYDRWADLEARAR